MEWIPMYIRERAAYKAGDKIDADDYNNWLNRFVTQGDHNTDAIVELVAFVSRDDIINVQSDWNQIDSTEDDFIKNKPAIKSGTGSYSIAEGFGITASGAYSHAEGSNTTASGGASHAEGFVTEASGDGSHAEGSNTEARGEDSHAEGDGTIASGEDSHAEGGGTIASGICSHAEGNLSRASGVSSHAEGIGTSAKGEGSHVEGADTTARGEYSHAQNVGTIAAKRAQTTLGRYNVEDTDISSTYGKYAVIVGNGILSNRSNALTIDWEGNVEASGDVTDGSGNVLAQKADPSDIPIKTSDLTNDSDFVSDANYVHTDNNYTTSEKTKLANIPDDAEKNVQSDWNQIDSTEDDFIKNKPAIKSGTGDYSIAEGRSTKANGDYSHAEGSNTTASGGASHAEGVKTIASSDGSHAEGSSTEASGDASHAEGYNTTASGNVSHAEGNFTTASGSVSHAEGENTIASGVSSHAQNEVTIAAKRAQTALGRYNIEDINSGGYGKYAVIVGNGSDRNNRSNALTIDWEGNIEASGDIIDGSGNKLSDIPAITVTQLQSTGTHIADIDIDGTTTEIYAPSGGSGVQSDWNQIDSTADDFIKNKPAIKSGTGDYSIAEGREITASGACAHAEGDTTTASGSGSHAEGGGTTASGVSSHAEGYYTTAYGDFSHTEGNGTITRSFASHAEGSGTTANGFASHAQNIGTIASKSAQTALGQYNVEDFNSGDYGKYAVIVGNGTNVDNRSNALTVDWDGNVEASGDVTDGSGNKLSDIPTKTSDLTNDSNFVSDASYVHTDSNYTASEKSKLAGIEAGAEENVQSNWNQTDSTADDYIKNKPSIPTKTSDLTNDSNYVTDASYIHTDNNYTTAEKTKLAGVESGAEVNVQSDWNQTTTTADDFIKNKPAIKSDSGAYSIIEGGDTTASGGYSHAEGYGTEASGICAHAEGDSTIASGDLSHAQNFGTIAGKSSQTALGRYNSEDTNSGIFGKYAVIVGNGTADNDRSNALTVGWNGDVEASGDITDGSGNALSNITNKQDTLVSGTNIKTINNQTILTSGDIEVPIVAEYGVTTYAELLTVIQATNGVVVVRNIPYNNEVIDVLVNWYSTANNAIEMESIATASGDLCDVDIQVTSASAWSVTFTSRDPFMLLDFNQSLNVTIPVCTKNVANTQIPNVDISISDELGVDWSIASLVKYEVKDSNGNRVNCWPVCQFSMNGQKTLRLRMMCGGTTDKAVASVSGAILLKHR